jgi:hypothetical protein
MKTIPVTRNFKNGDIGDVVGTFNPDTLVITFLNPEDVMENGAIALGYHIASEDVVAIAGTNFVKKVTLTEVSIVDRRNLVYDA